jgi:hypothetical protein
VKSAESRVESLSPVLLGLPIGLMLLNLLLRQADAFPPELSDEANWLGLMQLMEGGFDPPVSGPLFVYVVQAVYEHLSFRLPAILDSVAILGSGLTTALMLSGYRYHLPNTTLIKSAAIMLLVTSYFLAPALEARPQQLGIALTFLICLQVTSQPQTSTGWLLAALLPLAFWHVLSFFVAIAYLSVWNLTLWRLGSLRGGAILLWFVLASSLLVSLIGSRAYRSLLEDVLANHLPGKVTLALLIIASVLLATCFCAVPVRLWRKVRALCLSHIDVVVAIIFLLSVTALFLQWRLLPSTALQDYGGSVVIFCVWHAGNVGFCFCYLLGLQICFRGEVDGLQAFVSGSLILLVLASFALFASLFLAHVNWMIRILYFWVPFAAPLSALGLGKLLSHAGKFRHFILVCLFMASLSHVVRLSIL